MFMGLTKSQQDKLQYEVISEKARLKLTRLIRNATFREESDIALIFKNRYINMARNILGLPLYVLNADDWGEYYPSEYAWHNGELELLMRRPNTSQLIETLADYIQNHMLDADEVYQILEEDGVLIKFIVEDKFNHIEVSVYIPEIEEIESELGEKEHPNIRMLVNRIDASIQREDYPNVLHACASIF